MTRQQVYKELIKEYDKKRTAARIDLDARRAEIYDMVPRIREIDAEISAEGFNAAFAALGVPEKSAESAKAYKQKCDALIKEKNAILKEAGIPRKYLAPHYECKECGDTGYIGTKECKCLKRRRIAMIYNSYKLKDRLSAETFDNFDFRYYSSKKDNARGESPKKNMEKIVTYCLKYARDFATRKDNLLFYGEPGLGKTFLCNSIAKELIDAGYIVVYITAFSLFSLISDIQLGKIDTDEARMVMDDVLKSDLLIIDDVGTEFSTILTGTGFFNIINSRAVDNAPVILSTNMHPNHLKELYSERVSSRITGTYTMFEFFGEDIRPLKKYGKFLE